MALYKTGQKFTKTYIVCSPEADYVNTDIINELIKEQDISNGSSNSRHHQHHPNAAILERPKSVAEISQKENGCVIKIKGDEVRYNFSKMHIIVVPEYQVPHILFTVAAVFKKFIL